MLGLINIYGLLAFVLSSEASQLLSQLSLVYKDTYVVYGAGRRSERDLPVCEGAYEACNLAHSRPWLTPITERFCRCPRRTQCPLSYEEGHSPDSQHVSNRSQLKFCEALDESLEACDSARPALELFQQRGPKGAVTRTSLFCRCPWPRAFVLNETSAMDKRTQILNYVCSELPQSQPGATCGHIRRDTYEVYYTHACPTDHLCVFREPFTSSTPTARRLALLHFDGEAYEAVCTHK